MLRTACTTWSKRHDTQNIHNLDFDVEGGQLDNTTLNTNPQQRHKRLQADFRICTFPSHYP